VVSLLERRHSWSDTDLERYMSLIRSEHINDQAVQSAKDAVTAAEQSLDEARNKMEKMERMQYHEEQIWSDTIRRNSTWVTFGLMGVNILLLLVTMGVVEPWRRKRMVREIKAALEEKMTPPASFAPLVAPAVAVATEFAPPVVEEEKKEEPIIEKVADVPLAVVEEVPTTDSIPTEATLPLADAEPQTLEERISDLFSDRLVSVRQRDISTVALEGAAAGALVAAILIAFLRPR
jgi:sensitive to high expression protein 9